MGNGAGAEEAAAQVLEDLASRTKDYYELTEDERARGLDRLIEKEGRLVSFETNDVRHEFLGRHPRAVEAAAKHLQPDSLFDVRLDYYGKLTAKGVPHKDAVLLADKLVGRAVENEELRGALGESAHLVMALYLASLARRQH